MQKSLHPDPRHFSSHGLRLKTCKAPTCQHPSAVSLRDCRWGLFSQDKNQEMQKLNRIEEERGWALLGKRGKSEPAGTKALWREGDSHLMVIK